MASRRIKTWGVTVKQGDLILIDKSMNIYDNIENHGDQITLDDDNDDEEQVQKPKISIKKGLARHLTEEDILSNEYTIADVVLPLPGHDIFYPNNESAQWYNEYLTEDGMDPEDLKQNIRLYSLPGSYRKLIEIPQSVEWSKKTYKTPEDTLIKSDFEKIDRKNWEKPNLESKDKKNNEEKDKEKNEENNEENDLQKDEEKEENCIEMIENENLKTAVIIQFTLSSSTYATMALREILKIDTSASNQMKLNILLDKELENAKISELNESENVVSENESKRKTISDDGDEDEEEEKNNDEENNRKKLRIE